MGANLTEVVFSLGFAASEASLSVKLIPHSPMYNTTNIMASDKTDSRVSAIAVEFTHPHGFLALWGYGHHGHHHALASCLGCAYPMPHTSILPHRVLGLSASWYASWTSLSHSLSPLLVYKSLLVVSL